jgi:hypothetical protein
MIELLTVAALVSYVVYLRYFVDRRTQAEKQAEANLRAAHEVLGTSDGIPAPFLDQSLLKHAGFTLLNSCILLVIIKGSSVIHWPFLVAAASAATIGFAEPRKGWVLALLQAVLLWVGYTFLVGPSASGVDRKIELFSLYGSIGLTFVGSYLGSILKRAQA